jgi:stage III sporulation protein AA
MTSFLASTLSSSFAASSSSSSSSSSSLFFRAREPKLIIRNCRRRRRRENAGGAQRSSGNSSLDEGVMKSDEGSESRDEQGTIDDAEALLMSDSFDEADLQARQRQIPRTPEEVKASLVQDGKPNSEKSKSSSDGGLKKNLASVTDENELNMLLRVLPSRIREQLHKHERKLELIEVVMDVGRVPLARFPEGPAEPLYSKDSLKKFDVWDAESSKITMDDIDEAVSLLGEVGGDNRAGIDGTLHRISMIRNRRGTVIGLTCRVGRAVKGAAELCKDLVSSEETSSVLLLGPPGVGKTTAIREMSRLLSADFNQRVVIVDTSNEIGGDGDVAHPGVGNSRRMQVADPKLQHAVLIEAVENHTPQVVIVDEIGTEEEAVAARTISERGVKMIATAHGHTLENVLKNPSLCDLVGGVQSVTLGDDEARRRRGQKTILEREGPPTFSIAVEMLDIGLWRVHTDVASSVDALLAGQAPFTELRALREDGVVVQVPEFRENSRSYASNNGIGASAPKFGVGAMQSRSRPGSAATSSPYGSRSSLATEAAVLKQFTTSPNINEAYGSSGYLGADERDSGLRRKVPRPSAPPPLTSAGYVAQEIANAALLRERKSSASEKADAMMKRRLSGDRSVKGSMEDNEEDEDDEDDEDDDFSSEKSDEEAVLCVFPFELNENEVRKVFLELGFETLIHLVSRLEDADAILGVKTRVKSAKWLRHAARSRGIPIYAMKTERPVSLIKAARAMLGESDISASEDDAH